MKNYKIAAKNFPKSYSKNSLCQRQLRSLLFEKLGEKLHGC